MHVERLGGHWRGALELALGREHALREPVARKKSALYFARAETSPRAIIPTVIGARRESL